MLSLVEHEKSFITSGQVVLSKVKEISLFTADSSRPAKKNFISYRLSFKSFEFYMFTFSGLQIFFKICGPKLPMEQKMVGHFHK